MCICSEFFIMILRLFFVSLSCILFGEVESVDKMVDSLISVLLNIIFLVIVLLGKGYEVGNNRDR